MVWGNGGCEFFWLAASFTFSTNTEGNVRLRRANSSIGKRTMQASIGLPAIQDHVNDRTKWTIDILIFKKFLRRVDRSGGECPIGS
jgi:hypothetical protein